MGGIAAEVVGGECLKFPLRRKSAFLSEHLRPQVAGNRDLEVSNCIPLPCVCHSVPYGGHRRRLCETELGAALPVRERERHPRRFQCHIAGAIAARTARNGQAHL